MLWFEPLFELTMKGKLDGLGQRPNENEVKGKEKEKVKKAETEMKMVSKGVSDKFGRLADEKEVQVPSES